MRRHFEHGWAFLRRCLVLARDEWRALSRSRRGRGWALLYTLFILLPLLLYFWIRARLPVSVPMDATVAAWYLWAPSWVGLLLALVLGHDTLTRGEHEGWQEGFASLPVGEFTWLLGRTSGRLSWLVVLLAIPFVLGWATASLWAHRALNPVPFLSVFIGGPLLAVLLYFPLAVVAGCLGNSLLGACLVLFVAFVFGMMGASLVPEWLFGAAFNPIEVLFWRSPETLVPLVQVLLDRYWWWSPISDVPEAGYMWPPVASSLAKIFAARLAGLGWCLLFLLGPWLVRLRRRPGRWKPSIRGMPTFARWLSETVDQVKPVRPQGRAARAAGSAAGLLLLAAVVWVSLTAPPARARESEVFMLRYGVGQSRPWPNRFVPAERSLKLALDGPYSLSGEETLTGTVLGAPGRPLPFALSPGMELTSAEDGEGRPCRWWREIELAWVTPPFTGAGEIRFTFRGSPRRVQGLDRRMADSDIVEALASRTWDPLNPQVLGPRQSGLSRWHVDLEGLSWAPEPAQFLVPEGRYLGREPCWGPTALELTLPLRLVPLPLPGDFQQERRGRDTVSRWRGRSPILPPVVTGNYIVRARPGSPPVTAAVVSPGSDVDGLLDLWSEAWAERPQDVKAGPLVLWPSDLSNWREMGQWRYAAEWASLAQVAELEPPRLTPEGIVRITPFTAERRPMKAPDPEASAEVRKRVAFTRARFRYAPLAQRMADAQRLVRMAAWRLCLTLESWPPASGSLELSPGLNSRLPMVKSIDLSEEPPPTIKWRDDDYKIKLDLACIAVTEALGPEGVEAGLGRIASRTGKPASFDEFWKAMAGERSEELVWLRDSLFSGRAISKPALTEVTFGEAPGGYRVRCLLENTGSAPVVVPLRALGGGVAQTQRVRVEPGGEAEATFLLKEPPERVVLDPDGVVLREKPGRGLSWTRKGGLK